ncbi:helix-turn-helix domain-containing protein [Dolosigranulum pigrum]|uniref:helix-turn-helix domain-containing protein n=1 Tax=Dolosigranulum pigrum TaxID=29394 RepID=UPI00370D40DD
MENNFRVLLAEKKLRMTDVHEVTGVSMTTLGNLYHERTSNPSLQVLKKLCEALDCTLDELIPMEEQN